MNILLLGAGNVGRAIAFDFVTRDTVAKVTIVDVSHDKLKELATFLKSEKVNIMVADIMNEEDKIVQEMKDHDVVCSALPGKIGFKAIELALKANTDIVDVSYNPENPFKAHDEAKEKGITIIPDCGVAPGMSNLLVGHAASLLDEVTDVEIIVGGLPMNPKPPLYYSITWSVEDLIEEYTRPARIVLNGEIKEVDPLSHIEEIDLGPLGKFEAIYTDGLRTLLKTIKAKNMVEKTIRYPGHFSKIRVLKDLGFLSSRKIRIGEEIITPKKFSTKILEEALRSFDFRDLVIMRIRVSGKKNGRSFIYQFDMVDKFDPQTNLTAMARTTGFTCAIAARLVAKGLIDTGVQPLEKIGSDMKLYGIFIEELAKRGIKVAERAL